MRVFVPASASADSTYLLYYALTNTDHEIITRICTCEALEDEVQKKKNICKYLSKNIREFDYGKTNGIAEYEVGREDSSYKTILNSVGYLANQFKCDMIYFGYNTHNWSMTNWFFLSDDNEKGTESFYDKNSKFNDLKYNISRQTHFCMREQTDIPIYWPFMNDKKDHESALGRWQIYESLPENLKGMIHRCDNVKDNCGLCTRCRMLGWYMMKKEAGATAKQLDDEIMRLGRYGKYWDKDTKPEYRYSAYGDFIYK